MPNHPQPILGGQPSLLATDHGAVATEEAGEGAPILLLHAPEPGGSRGEWAKLFPLLVQAGYRVEAIDLLGFGDSAQPAALDAEAELSNLRQVVGHAGTSAAGATGGLPASAAPASAADTGGQAASGTQRGTPPAYSKQPLHLVARGHAAAYAVALTAEAAEVVQTLTLINPYGLTSAQPPVPASGRLMLRRAVASWLREQVYFDPSRATAEEVRRIAADARRPVVHALRAGRLALDVSEQWPEIELPVLLIWGEACDGPPLDDAESWLMPVRKGAPFVMLDGRPVGVWKRNVTYKTFAYTRQRPHVEAADAVAEAILDHLAAATESPPSGRGLG